MAEMMEDVMDLVYEHLSPAEIDAHHKEIVHLPDVLMAREDDALEGITIGKLVIKNRMDFRQRGVEPEPGLIVATKFRVVVLIVNMWGQASEGWNALYSEIVTVDYSDSRLKIRKIGEDVEFDLCAEKSLEHFLNILRQRISGRYDNIMKKVMSVVHEQLSPAEIDAHHEEIMYLPEALISRDEIEVLEGVAVNHLGFSPTLIVSTNLRVVEISIQDKKAKVSWDVLYSEIDTVNYDNDLWGRLKIRKKKGWLKTMPFYLRSERYGNPPEFLICLRRHIPIFVDGAPIEELFNENELADDTMVSDDTVMARQFADFLRDKLDIHDAVLEQDTSAADEQPKEERQNSPPVVQSNVSVADELRKFAELRDLGIITDEEFEAQKAKLLGM